MTERTIDLLPALRSGTLDAAGPVVDFGDAQQSAYVLPPLPLGATSQQGDGFALVGARVRVRVPIDLANPPTALRVRMRRVRARAVLALVDGVPVRQATIPQQSGPARAVVLSLPLIPERFRREQAEVELRFLGVSRAAALASSAASRAASVAAQRARARRGAARRTARGLAGRAPEPRPFDPYATRPRTQPGGAAVRPTPPTSAAVVAELDWLHLARDETPALRAADLVGDVRIEGLPRRSAAFYAPGRIGTLLVVPGQAVLRSALAVDGVRGPEAHAVRARVRVESDEGAPIEHVEQVEPGAPWHEVRLDLAPLAGRVARISFVAERLETDEPPPLAPERPPSARAGAAMSIPTAPRRPSQTRLAVAEPRIEFGATQANDAPGDTALYRGEPPARHAVLVIVRGLRTDRVLPEVDPRFVGGGLARVGGEGIALSAVAPSMRPVAALASAVSGLPADLHGLTEWTDTLADEAPTLATVLREAGVSTAGFSDDPWWIGSGLDRGFAEAGSCVSTTVPCRADAVLARAADFLVQQRDRRAFALVLTRAGVPPFDPPPELLTSLDPTPSPTALTGEQTGLLAQRAHRGPLAIDTATSDRLRLLYDASLLGADRGVAQLIDRLREAHTLERTLVVVVGDRGTPLGEGGFVGEGPVTLSAASHTLLAMRGAGIWAGSVPAERGTEGAAREGLSRPVAGVLDAAATILERMGVAAPEPLARSGAISWGARRAGVPHPRGVVFSAGARGEPGLRFSSLVAVPRAGGALALFTAEMGPETPSREVTNERPIARAFAEAVLAQYQSDPLVDETRVDEPGDDDRPRGALGTDAPATGGPRARAYEPSTRALPDPVAATLRATGALRR